MVAMKLCLGNVGKGDSGLGSKRGERSRPDSRQVLLLYQSLLSKAFLPEWFLKEAFIYSGADVA